nr:hypothetical protein Iba_chr04fCG9770 [Ipomoea batatas]
MGSCDDEEDAVVEIGSCCGGGSADDDGDHTKKEKTWTEGLAWLKEKMHSNLISRAQLNHDMNNIQKSYQLNNKEDSRM